MTTRRDPPRIQVRGPAAQATAEPRPGPGHLRGRDLPADDAHGRRRRRVLVLGQLAPRPARRRRRRPRRRGPCCRTTGRRVVGLAKRKPRKNGYTEIPASNTHRVTPAQDPSNPRRLDVTITAHGRHVLHARHRHPDDPGVRGPPRPSSRCRSRWAARRTTTASASSTCRRRTRSRRRPRSHGHRCDADATARSPAASGRRPPAARAITVGDRTTTASTRTEQRPVQQAWNNFGCSRPRQREHPPTTHRSRSRREPDVTILGIEVHLDDAFLAAACSTLHVTRDRRPAVEGTAAPTWSRPQTDTVGTQHARAPTTTSGQQQHCRLGRRHLDPQRLRRQQLRGPPDAGSRAARQQPHDQRRPDPVQVTYRIFTTTTITSPIRRRRSRCGTRTTGHARPAELLGRDAEPGRAERPGRRLHDRLRDADRARPTRPTTPPSTTTTGSTCPPGGGEVWIFDPGFCDTVDRRDTHRTRAPARTGPSAAERQLVGAAGERPVRPLQGRRQHAVRVPGRRSGRPRPARTSGASTWRTRTSAANNGNAELREPDAGTTSGGSSPANLPAGKYRLHTTSRISPTSPTRPRRVRQPDDTTALNAFAIWTQVRQRHAAGLRPGRDGGVLPALGRQGLHLLPGPDRGCPRRQVDGHRPVGPGRHRRAAGDAADPAADDVGVAARTRRRRSTTTRSPGRPSRPTSPAGRARRAAPGRRPRSRPTPAGTRSSTATGCGSASTSTTTTPPRRRRARPRRAGGRSSTRWAAPAPTIRPPTSRPGRSTIRGNPVHLVIP